MAKEYQTAGPRHAHVPYDPYYPDQGTKKHKNREITPVSTGNWIWTFILCCIPIVNFVMFCVWTFSRKVVPSKKNFGRAWFILSVIAIVLVAVTFVIMVYLFNYDFGALYTEVIRDLTTTVA